MAMAGHPQVSDTLYVAINAFILIYKPLWEVNLVTFIEQTRNVRLRQIQL